MTRIILAYPGGEITLFQYKREVPAHQVSQKLASIAMTLFPSWDWASEIPAIESGSDKVLMAVSGPSGEEPSL